MKAFTALALPVGLALLTTSSLAETHRLFSWRLARVSFNHPQGIVVSVTGDVYVADVSHNRIQEFSDSGATIRTWGTPGTGPAQFNTPTAIALGPERERLRG